MARVEIVIDARAVAILIDEKLQVTTGRGRAAAQRARPLAARAVEAARNGK